MTNCCGISCNNVLPTNWKLREFPGKGCGVVATRDILIGERIMEDRPTFVLSTRPSWFVPTESQILQKISKTFTMLSSNEKKEYMSLYASPLYYTPLKKEQFDFQLDDEYRALGIFKSNAYPLSSYGIKSKLPSSTTIDSGQDAAVYLNISRLNSSCDPNVHYYYDVVRNIGTIHCIKFIKKDEEILNTYISLFLSKNERLGYLQKSFGFYCDCSVCRLQGYDSTLSDQRRVRLMFLENETHKRIHMKYNNNNNNIIQDNIEINNESRSSNDIELNNIDLINERIQLLNDENIATPSTLFKVYLDGFLLINPYLLTLQQFLNRQFTTSIVESDSYLNESVSTERNQSFLWLQLACDNIYLCKGEQSLEFQSCKFYLSKKF